jgi:hypothetical protein
MASVFGSITSRARVYLDNLKAKRQAENEQDELEKTYERKESIKQVHMNSLNEAKEHHKNKAIDVLNDNNQNLGKRISAINEIYKDDKPKGSNVVQEINDRSYLNRYRRDMRLEKNRLLKQLVQEEKTRKQMESINKRMVCQERNGLLKAQREMANLIMKAKAERNKR